MQIQKVQPNQINFGTRVYLEGPAKDILLMSGARRKFINHISKLESNGIDDVFVLRHEYDNNLVPMDFLYGVVFEKRQEGIFKTPYGSVDALVIKSYHKLNNKYADLLQMYKEAKNNWIMREMDKKKYEKYMSEVVTIK